MQRVSPFPVRPSHQGEYYCNEIQTMKVACEAVENVEARIGKSKNHKKEKKNLKRIMVRDGICGVFFDVDFGWSGW